MNRLIGAGPLGPLTSAWRGVVLMVGALAAVTAAGLAAVLTVVFAVAVLIIALMAGALITFSGLTARPRRSGASADGDVIEARNIGGHSWIAYGFEAAAKPR